MALMKHIRAEHDVSVQKPLPLAQAAGLLGSRGRVYQLEAEAPMGPVVHSLLS